MPHINASLSDRTDVSEAVALDSVKDPQRSFQGVKLGYDGFQVTHEERARMIAADPRNAEVVKPWLIGRDLLTGDGTPSRCVIDFAAMNQFEAREFGAPWAWAEEHVLPEVRAKVESAKGSGMEQARRDHLDRWWQFWNVRHDMREAFAPLGHYLACSQTTKRAIFSFIPVGVSPDAALQVWALNDNYSFGLLQSAAHAAWFEAKCSKLEARLRYTRRSVWDTFPWPQSPAPADVEAVAAAAVAVRGVRSDALRKLKGGLRGLYRTLDQPGKNPLRDAHAALDAAALRAYGFSPKADLLAQLLDLNESVAAAESARTPVTAPGIPASYTGDRAALVTPNRVTA